MRKDHNHSIKNKVFHNMVAVSSIFILIILICYSVIIYNYLTKTGNDNSIAQLDYISSHLDYYLSSIENYGKAIIIDDTIQKETIAYNNTSTNFPVILKNQIKKKINNIIQSNSFIYSVNIYSINRELIVSTGSGRYVSSYQLPAFTKDVWISKQVYDLLEDRPNIHLLSYIQPFYSLQTGQLIGYSEISIDERSIYEIYKDSASSTSHIFMTDKNGIVKSSDRSIELDTVFPIRKYCFAKQGAISNGQITFTEYIPELNWYIVNIVAMSEYLSPIFSAIITAFVITIICIICCFIASRHLAAHVTQPLYNLINHILKVRKGYWTTINTPVNDTDISLLYKEFNNMIHDQEKLKNRLVEEQKEKSRISLNLLQQQVNPHFLYNTLDNICALAELDEKETLIDLVMNLSTFYRASLCKGKFRISLGEELTLTKAYLHIMTIRYYNKFTYEINCPEEYYSCACIKLLLQPLVENSIYHGIKEIDYKGHLSIDVTCEDDDLIIVVSDNGKGYTEKDVQKFLDDKHHFGVWNIHKRIQLYFGEQYGLTMDHAQPHGCIITIRIPKQKETEHEI